MDFSISDITDLLSSSPEWVVYKREWDSRITASEFWRLTQIARDDSSMLRVGLDLIRRGYPLDVAHHTIRAFRAFSIKRPKLDKMGFAWEDLCAGMALNDLLALRLAELAGKVAAKLQGERQVAILIVEAAEREHGTTMHPMLTFRNREEAHRKCEKARTDVAKWESWQENPELISSVGAEMFRVMKNLLPKKVSLLPGMQKLLKHSGPSDWDPNKGTFTDLYAHPKLAEAVQQMEGLTARLEQWDLDAMEPYWLFKTELKQEREALENWTSSPEVIKRVKKSLAKRLDELIDMKDFGDEEWVGPYGHSTVNDWENRIK